MSLQKLKKKTQNAKYLLGVLQETARTNVVYRIVVMHLNRSLCDFLGTIKIDSKKNSLKIVWVDYEKLRFWLSKRIKINKFLYNMLKTELIYIFLPNEK